MTTAGKSINFMTGNTFHDAASFVFPTGTVNGSFAGANLTLAFAMRIILGAASNPEELMPAILDWYPDMNSDDDLTRQLATTEAWTDWFFGSGSSWEATARAR